MNLNIGNAVFSALGYHNPFDEHLRDPALFKQAQLRPFLEYVVDFLGQFNQRFLLVDMFLQVIQLREKNQLGFGSQLPFLQP